MLIKEQQKAPLQKDLKRGVVIIAVLTALFAQYLIGVKMSVPVALFSLVAFILFVSPFILGANPTLVKVCRADLRNSGKYFIIALLLMFGVVQLYAIATGQFNIAALLQSGVWLLIAAAAALLLKKLKVPSFFDYLLVLILWLPIEFGLLGNVNIPPVQGFLNPFALLSLFILIFAYLVVRQFDIGYSFRLSGEDIRIIILDFIVFFLIAIIIGMISGFLHISDRIPAAGELFMRFATIFFFIAIPEELLFRGVIYRLIFKQLQGKSYSVGKALVISSLIFGLAHGNNPVPPFLDISFGGLGVWHVPWAYILLASIAGMFYGYVFIRTKKIMAAAALHLLVDWTWFVFFNG